MIEKYTDRARATLADAEKQGKQSQMILGAVVGAIALVAIGAGVTYVAVGGNTASPDDASQQLAALTVPAAVDTNLRSTERRGLRYQPVNDIAPEPRPENLPAPVVANVVPVAPMEDPLEGISLPDLEQLVTRSIGTVAAAPLGAEAAPVIADVATALTAQPAPAVLVPAAAPVPEVPICVEQLAVLSQAVVVPFDLGAIAPNADDLDLLRRTTQVLAGCEGMMLAIEGHSDVSGSDLQNIALSWQRAEATIAMLAAEGYDTSRLEPLGFGARRLLDTSGTDAAHAINRRVTTHIAPIPGSDIAILFQN